MSYYQASPAQYGGQPGYGGYPNQQGGPPGMGAPPGMGPPPGMPPAGMGPAPGMQQPQNHQSRGFPPNFQPPPNMPDINFAAPVIRLGTSGPSRPDQPANTGGNERRGANNEPLGNRRAMGLGFDNRDQQKPQIAVQPPTREEVARTIFIGNIPDDLGGEENLERILNIAGGLRRWLRVIDADSKPCSFGFAEYEDADSLSTASEVLKNVPLPGKQPVTNGAKSQVNGAAKADDESREEHDGQDAMETVNDASEKEEDKSSKANKLLVVIDEASEKYIEDWRGKGSLKDPAEAQFRIDSAKEELHNFLASLARPAIPEPAAQQSHTDQSGDSKMMEQKTDAETGEVVTIPIPEQDELSDIPTEMRETVTKEIQAFRDRSNRRDMERLRKEEEIEQAEKNRANAARINSVGSVGTSTNNIPLGPRDRSVQGAPIGPKAFQGAQIPRDYQKGVSFVNGNGVASAFTPEEEDSDASDGELERRRQEKKNAELEKIYLDQERRWLNRERSRTAALEREKQRDDEENENIGKEKAAMAHRLKEWNDDVEASRLAEEYYKDRSMWLRNRSAFRAQEQEADDRDRMIEERSQARLRDKKDREMGVADQFLARQAAELESRADMPREPQRFKMSLGTAAQKSQTGQRRNVAEVEGLLEDEEENEAGAKRSLVPITFDSSAPGAGLSEEERQQAARQLAQEIPSDRAGLWSWDVKWDFVDDTLIVEQLRPFVEKKIVEYLGVQEQMLVDVVEEAVRRRSKPDDLVQNLEGALDEDAEAMVKKLWRMLIFFSETEKRGLGG